MSTLLLFPPIFWRVKSPWREETMPRGGLQRGAFIVLEGLDRSGKSTQVRCGARLLAFAPHPSAMRARPDCVVRTACCLCKVARLAEYLNAKGVRSANINFPNRTTAVGSLINSYLQSGQELGGCPVSPTPESLRPPPPPRAHCPRAGRPAAPWQRRTTGPSPTRYARHDALSVRDEHR